MVLINLMCDPWFNSQIGSWREAVHRRRKTEGSVSCDSVEFDSIGLWFGLAFVLCMELTSHACALLLSSSSGFVILVAVSLV